METKVSVIVPVYNAEPYLRQCLDSLVNQTMPVEIIVVDNCSTDGSANIIREYEAARANVRAFYNSANKGQAYSINKGLDTATGAYIAECDADDWAEPNMYEALYRAAERDYCDVVRCNIYKHYNGEIHTYANLNEGYNKVLDIRCLDSRGAMWMIGRWCNIMAGIYRRSFIIDNDLRYREGGIFEDNSLSFKIRTTAHRYEYIADYLYHYRMDNTNSGTHQAQKVWGIFEQFDEIERYSKLHNINLWPQICAWKYAVYIWAYKRLTNEQEKLNFLNRCRQDFQRDLYQPDLFNNQEDKELYEQIRWGHTLLGSKQADAPTDRVGPFQKTDPSA